MSRELQVSDRLAIHELLARYAWSLDTGDIEAFVACFSAEGELSWNVFDRPGRWKGHAALRRFIHYFTEQPESAGRQHHVSNVIIEPHDEGAAARSYVFVALRSTAGPHLMTVMGHYADVLVHEDGKWRFLRRNIADWSGPVLSRFAGQSGKPAPRSLPPALDGLWSTQG